MFKPLTSKLSQTWNENPLGVIAALGTAVAAFAKLVDVTSSAKSRRAYARMMKRAEKRAR